mmetsp:Transcript_12032/g.24513  ORF Transcript_12032/g.24513 Transcript_12032/m.24513 type:complete len:312 (-) Transcript_12032:285-1220(-)|eukprot:CAMPEP_0184690654 /NCGR_PEP_ID=MMETSP0312-20130426/31353_1 /TAXON_ID=31354 /ORGANISM="Compsopogon coeruleus, Strain SAG 36.94" /LENGTH=311 /DNA_ID=CAMNT_0027148187 /DNA_START=147 /DNA_END=1082 /DNA_ORIENTATION=-
MDEDLDEVFADIVVEESAELPDFPEERVVGDGFGGMNVDEPLEVPLWRELKVEVGEDDGFGVVRDGESWIDSERSDRKSEQSKLIVNDVELPRVRVSLKEKREKERQEFPAEVIGEDWTGTTSSMGKKMTEEERKIMLFKRKLRNRESAARSRRRRQKTLGELQNEMEDLREDSEVLLQLSREFLKREEEFEKLESEKTSIQEALEEERSRSSDLASALDELTITKHSVETEANRLKEENKTLREELSTIPDEIRRVTGERDFLLKKILKDRCTIGLFGSGDPNFSQGFGRDLLIPHAAVTVGADDHVYGG